MPSYTIEFFNSFKDTCVTCDIDFSIYGSTFEKPKGKHNWAESNPLEKSIINILNKIAATYNEDIGIEMVRLIQFLNELPRGGNLAEYTCMCIMNRAVIDVKFLDSYATLITHMNYNSGVLAVCEFLFYKYISGDDRRNNLDNYCILVSKLYNNKVINKQVLDYIMNTLFTIGRYTEICSMLMSIDNVSSTFDHHLVKLRNLTGISNKIRFKILDLLDTIN